MDTRQLDSILTQATGLLRCTIDDNSPLKPTNFFNESWMTSLTLAVVNDPQRPLDVPSFRVADGGQWWCEAGLRSRFRPSERGDKKGEGSTWVDAVLGHFDRREKRGIQLRSNATQFAVIEAKMEARLSSKTSNAKDYDQAARNVACMVKELEPMRDRSVRPVNCLLALRGSLGVFHTRGTSDGGAAGSGAGAVLADRNGGAAGERADGAGVLPIAWAGGDGVPSLAE